jgi:uncharacterized protein
MKIINYATYIDDQQVVAGIRPTHRRYMDTLIADGRLIAGGPLADGTGALFIYDVASMQEARAIVAADPYSTDGAFAHVELKAWDVAKAQPTLEPVLIGKPAGPEAITPGPGFH